MGKRPRHTAQRPPKETLTWCFTGADDEIRTHDPHLGKKKAMVVIAKVMPCPPSRLFSASLSAQSAESAPVRPSWFNALNLCDIELDASVAEHGGDFESSAELGDNGAQHVEG